VSFFQEALGKRQLSLAYSVGKAAFLPVGREKQGEARRTERAS
jgi:hypothetical protein